MPKVIVPRKLKRPKPNQVPITDEAKKIIVDHANENFTTILNAAHNIVMEWAQGKGLRK